MRTPPAPIDPVAVDGLLRPFGDSRTLPAEAYRSADLLAWELEHIFGAGWICLGRVDDLLAPGQVRGVDLDTESVLLTRDAAGEIRAFSNVCRHRGHPLVEVGEALDARQIRCPYHSWAYRFDGTLRTAPTLTQTVDFDPADWPLIEIRTEAWLGWLFLNSSCDADTVAATYGNVVELLAPYEPERLVRVARHSYDVTANWKLLTENYHECYHCTSIHPELCEVTPVDSGRDSLPDGLWCGGTMDLKDHAETMSADGRSDGVAFRNLSPADLRTVLYVGLFPSLLVSAHPDYVMTHRLVPRSAGSTSVECEWLFAPETVEQPGFDPGYAVEFWDKVNWQDWTACQNVQRATAQRGFRPGPLSPWESTIYQVHNMLGHAYRGEGLRPPDYVPSVRLDEA